MLIGIKKGPSLFDGMFPASTKKLQSASEPYSSFIKIRQNKIKKIMKKIDFTQIYYINISISDSV